MLRKKRYNRGIKDKIRVRYYVSYTIFITIIIIFSPRAWIICKMLCCTQHTYICNTDRMYLYHQNIFSFYTRINDLFRHYCVRPATVRCFRIARNDFLKVLPLSKSVTYALAFLCTVTHLSRVLPPRTVQ